MEYYQLLGSRRSVRFFDPEHPVERDKVETVVQAARWSSRAMNVPWGKGIVVYRDELSESNRDALKTPFAEVEFDLAPVYLLWYFDTAARETALEGNHYPSVPSGVLQDTAIYGPPHGWSQKYIEKVVVPEVLMPGLGVRVRGGNADAGMALMQAYLAAVDEGLGACLVPFDEAGARTVLNMPEHYEGLAALLIGYSVESPEAGGQRPKAPFESCFFDGTTKKPYPRLQRVTDDLAAKGLIQEQAPIGWRKEEVRALSRGLGLAGGSGETPEREIPEGAPVNLGAIEDYPSVKTWNGSFSSFWRTAAPGPEWKATLEEFCRFAGADPDAIIDEILQQEPRGEGLRLRTQARRKWVGVVNDFETFVGREKANHIRSFLIHNGVAMNPSILK